MVDFGEIDVNERLAIVGARARPAMSFHQGPRGLRGNFEPFTQLGVRQHLDGHKIRSAWPGGHHPDTANSNNLKVKGWFTRVEPDEASRRSMAAGEKAPRAPFRLLNFMN